jgi:hypothetical protein
MRVARRTEPPYGIVHPQRLYSSCARRTIRSNTGCGSPGEADIAFSTSRRTAARSARHIRCCALPVRQSAWPAPQPVWPPVPAPRRVLAAVPRWRVEVRRSWRPVSRSLAVTTPRSMQKHNRHASGPGQSRGHVSPWLARPVTCGLPAGSDAKPSQRVDPNLPLRDTCCERPLRVAFGRSLGAPCPGFTLPMRRRTLDSMSPQSCVAARCGRHMAWRGRVYTREPTQPIPGGDDGGIGPVARLAADLRTSAATMAAGSVIRGDSMTGR